MGCMDTHGILRVSEAEREPVIERLKSAYAVGRISLTEFDARLHRAMTVPTRGELAAVESDLVPRRAAPQPRVSRPPVITGGERFASAAAHASGIVPVLPLPFLVVATMSARSPFVRHHTASALNFQLVLFLLVLVTFGIGAIVYSLAWVLAIAGSIVALTGNPFRYPVVPRLVT